MKQRISMPWLAAGAALIATGASDSIPIKAGIMAVIMGVGYAARYWMLKRTA